jgi:hypothetical protein
LAEKYHIEKPATLYLIPEKMEFSYEKWT